MRIKWLSLGILGFLSLSFADVAVAANEITFELINDMKEPVSFALAKVGESEDDMVSRLQEIAGNKKVLDKISDDQRQVLISFGSERQLYVISEKPGKHFKLKFGPKRPFSKEMVLAAQIFATSNISTSDIVLTKKQLNNGPWEVVKAEEKVADKKDEKKKGDAKSADTDAEDKSSDATVDEDDIVPSKKTITANQLLGVNSSDPLTRDRQILGFGNASGKLTFESAMTTKLSAKGAQKTITDGCANLLELWSGDGVSKKERERIMELKKVPKDEMDELASDAHGLIEKACDRVKEKFPSKDAEDDWWN